MTDTTQSDADEVGIIDQQPSNTQVVATRNDYVSVSATAGGVDMVNMRDAIELAKLMSKAAEAIPPHCREKPGTCLALILQAVEWKMSPFQVANKSYVVNDRIAYEAQLIHAIIEARAPIKERLKFRYEGEGMQRRCIVSGTFKGEDDPREFVSETLERLMPEKKTKDGVEVVKGSPLWLKKPDVQLAYNASRDWARMFCPDVLLGIYAAEEAEETPVDVVAMSSPKLLERLPAKIAGAEGFSENVVTDVVNGNHKKKSTKRDSARSKGQLSAVAQASNSGSDTPPAAGSPGASTPSAGSDAGVVSGPHDAGTGARPEETERAAGGTPVGARSGPETAEDYVNRWDAMLKGDQSIDDLEARWDGEMDLRNELRVPIKARNRIAESIREKAAPEPAAKGKKR